MGLTKNIRGILLAIIIAIIIIILIIVRLFIFGNDKDMDKYDEKQAFLISDKNWEEVMSLVPVTTWTDGSTYKYPTLIFHEETSSFDADSIIHFLQQYEPDKLIVVGSIPVELTILLTSAPELGAGLAVGQIESITMNDYLSYWDHFKNVVYVEDDYKLSLLASTYASLINAPLIVEGTSLDSGFVFTGRRVTCIGSVTPTYGRCKYNYNLEQLQEKYIDKTSTDKVILVNPKDLDISFIQSFQPEKSVNPIDNAHFNISLSAPILASAKHEVMIFTEIEGLTLASNLTPSVNQVDNDVKTSVESLFAEYDDPAYLTIVGVPLAIPDAISGEYYVSKDWLYGSMNDTNPLDANNLLLRTGRIYGITTSDASAYIARDIFYDDLFDDYYAADEHTGLAIGHSFNNYRVNMPIVRNMTELVGYDTPCFIDQASVLCTNDISPNISFYEDRQFTVYGDHGGCSSWSGTISTAGMQTLWLDLDYVFAHACSTMGYWSNYCANKVIGVQFLRRGAISYQGAVVSSNNDGPRSSERASLEYFTDGTNKDLGMVSNLLKDEFSSYKRHYMLLGDPTLQPKFEVVAWP